MQNRDQFRPRAPGRLALLLFGVLLASATHGAPDSPFNAIHPGEVWLDDHGTAINAHGGGVLRYGGAFYWFGEHKIEGELGNTAQVGVHVYSSRDLCHWKDQGIALAVSDDPSSEIVRGCILERPKVLYNEKTGKFVMWFHLELKGRGYHSARSGVAVADQVAGPYRYLRSLRPNAGVWPEDLPPDQRKPLSPAEQEQLAQYSFSGGPPAPLPFPTNLVCRRDFQTGQMARDMTLFLDDDGKAYHIYASEENGTLQISQLTDDFLAPAGHFVRLLVGQFNEAPALFKKDGKYYLFASGTTGWAPNAARSFSANSLRGPWSSLGNPCRGTTAQRKTTFDSQSTYVLPLAERGGALVFMADRWRPRNPIDGRYVWLPVLFDNSAPTLEWRDNWSLDTLDGRVAAGANGETPAR
ncbi:MAG: glycoside hydrolase family 43 protein [Verrucomicrobiota bacterium]|jgi:hypothetical protein